MLFLLNLQIVTAFPLTSSINRPLSARKDAVAVPRIISYPALVATHIRVPLAASLVEDVLVPMRCFNDSLEEFDIRKLATIILGPFCAAENLDSEALSTVQVDDLADNLVHGVDGEVGITAAVRVRATPSVCLKTYRFRMIVTASEPQVKVAWSPATVVTTPNSRTIEAEGCAEGAKAWRCEGRMRGDVMEFMVVSGERVAADLRR